MTPIIRCYSTLHGIIYYLQDLDVSSTGKQLGNIEVTKLGTRARPWNLRERFQQRSLAERTAQPSTEILVAALRVSYFTECSEQNMCFLRVLFLEHGSERSPAGTNLEQSTAAIASLMVPHRPSPSLPRLSHVLVPKQSQNACSVPSLFAQLVEALIFQCRILLWCLLCSRGRVMATVC